MRVFSATLATETNTFSPIPTGLDSFREGSFHPAGKHPAEMSFFAGPLHAARLRAQALGLTVVQGLVAAAQPSGIVTRAAYESLRDQLLDDLRQALPVDIVLLGLHGAMAADGYDDCEGDLLRRVREIVGPEVVVGATLDPHGHVGPVMVAAANVLICWKHYPHTDALERALELVDLCVKTRQGLIRPQAVLVDARVIVLIHTTREPGAGMVKMLEDAQALPGVLSASIVHGFPWGDVPEMGTRALVYFDAQQPGAQATAQAVADAVVAAIWAQRAAFAPPYLAIDDAYDTALTTSGGPVVIADGADNPGGGAGCDATYMLRRLLQRRIQPSALGPLHDPGAVAMAFNAGLGAQLLLRIGGKVSALSGEPLDVQVTVRGLARQHTMAATMPGVRVDCGDSVWLEIEGGIHVVLTTARMQAMHPDLFTGLGCDLSAMKIVVVKSSQHFQAGFAPIASRVLYADAPGTLTQDLRSLQYKKADLQRWPFVDAVPGQPVA